MGGRRLLGLLHLVLPLRVPPAAAGPQPDLSISYDSGAVDGQTASSNNQGSQIGTGFDLTSSYIERKYHSCDDDGQDGKYDLCWKYDNASSFSTARPPNWSRTIRRAPGGSRTTTPPPSPIPPAPTTATRAPRASTVKASTGRSSPATAPSTSSV
ncbi:hypothetical protein ACFQ3Z_45400 [Streptomyces nogalater]